MKLLFIPTSLLVLLMSCEQAVEEQPSATKVQSSAVEEHPKAVEEHPKAVEENPSTAQNVQVEQETIEPSTPKASGAAITLEVEERDFGTIWDFQPVTTTFPFTNTGTKTLVLSRLQAGCGCTTPIADKTVLKPGETGTITVTFDPKGKSNKQDKKVTIFSNAVNEPEKGFWIRSYVNQFVDVKNKFLNLNEMTVGEPHSVEFEFVPVDPNFKISSMSGSGKHGEFISAEELKVPDGAPRRIRISISPEMPWGAFHSQLNVKGSGSTPDGSPITHEFTVLANGKSYGKIRADNHIIGLRSMKQGGSFHVRNTIFRTDGESFKVLNTAILQPTVSGINGTSVQNLDGSHSLIISGTLPASHKGPINAYLLVETDVPGEEVLRFRITGFVQK